MVFVACPNRGCCYAVGGGVAKCKKCDLEYKDFVSKRGDRT